MRFFDALLNNYMFISGVVGWLTAQLLKTAIDAYFNHGINWERMTGSGGMPSSHSSTVVALATAAAIQYGPESPYFSIACVFAIVVMYDATGVRRETGKQAVILNKMLTDNPFNWKPEEVEKKLKEYVGHTPLQVGAGAVLGLIVAFVVAAAYGII